MGLLELPATAEAEWRRQRVRACLSRLLALLAALWAAGEEELGAILGPSGSMAKAVCVSDFFFFSFWLGNFTIDF